MTSIELLEKHAKYVKRNNISSITEYNNVAKPSGYYATAQTLYRRYGREVVIDAFGWKKICVHEVQQPTNLSYNELAVKSAVAGWYRRLPKKKTFTVTDYMENLTEKYCSNVSNMLIHMADIGLLNKLPAEVDIRVGRPKTVYTRSANWKFKPFNNSWSIANK